MTYEKQTHIHTNNTHTHTLLFYFYFDNFTQRNVRDDFYDCLHLKNEFLLIYICAYMYTIFAFKNYQSDFQLKSNLELISRCYRADYL